MRTTPSAHYNLGAIYMEKGENEKALFHFQQALKNPSSLIDVQTAEKYIADLKAKQAAKETP